MTTPDYQGNCVYSVAMYKDFAKGFQYTHTRTTVLRCISVCVTLLLLIWVHWFSGFPEYFYRYYLLLAVIYFLLLGLQAFRLRDGGLRYKQMLVANGGKAPVTNYLFTDQEILFSKNDEDKPRSTDYSQIRYIFETNQLLVLVLSYSLCHPISKDSLGSGEYGFKAFLLERCSSLKRKHIRSITFGKFLHYCQLAVILCGLLLSLIHLPAVQRLADTARKNDDSSVYQIAEKLEALGITGADNTLLTSIDEYYSSNAGFYYSGNQKAIDLLSWLGAGEYDYETWQWTPSTSGVYWFDAEVMDVSAMYTDFLNGVCAASKGELVFTDIQEDLSKVNPESGTGSQSVSFRWNGQPYTLTGTSMYDWFDPQVANDLSAVIRTQSSEKQLYFAYDGSQGYFVFYCDSRWAEEFERQIGLELTNRIT